MSAADAARLTARDTAADAAAAVMQCHSVCGVSRCLSGKNVSSQKMIYFVLSGT